MWGAFMNKLFIKMLCVFLSFILLFTVLIFISKNNMFLKVNSILDKSERFTVIVDAGHGGEDGGAVALDGSVEKDFNLDIALKLENILKLYGYKVIMTRTTDTMTCDKNLKNQRQKKISDIKNRLTLTEKHNNSVLISIHQNKFSDNSQKGAQVFYSPNNFKSKELAELIQSSVVKNLQPDNYRKTKKCGTEIFLLYHSEIPSVLVECGFLSNQNELNLLKDNDYRNKIAILIADGILNFTI